MRPSPGTERIEAARGRYLDDISLVEMANVLLRRRGVIIAVPLLLLLLLVPARLLSPPAYTATAAIMPHQSGSSSRSLGNLAAQLGVTVSGEGGLGQSPAFYQELLTSRAILIPTLESTYTFVRDGSQFSGTLIDLLDIDETDPEVQTEAALGGLRDHVNVTTSRTTDIVRVAVTASAPVLAEQIAARMLELVNQFNLETRQSQARGERRFVADRMAEAHAELRAAEDELQLFLQRNRTFSNSPELTFAHSRLERDVGRRQELYSALAQAYEQARIDEVRDIPVITVIEAPVRPIRRDSRGVFVAGLVAIVLGLALGGVLAFLLDFLRDDRRSGQQDVQEFERLRQETLQDLRRPWRRLKGIRSTSRVSQ